MSERGGIKSDMLFDISNLLVCMYPASRLYIPLKHFVLLDTKCNFSFYPCQFHCLPFNKFIFQSTFLFRYASYRFPFYYSFLFFPYFPFVPSICSPFPSLYSFLFPFSLAFLVFKNPLELKRNFDKVTFFLPFYCVPYRCHLPPPPLYSSFLIDI